MDIKQFDFVLPENLIAQSPLDKREYSKLMVVNKKTSKLEKMYFYDIVDLLSNNSILVVNETKVIPARIFGKKLKTNANIEVLLLKEIDKDIWEVLVKPARKIKVGDQINFNDLLLLTCIKSLDEGIKIMKLSYKGNLINILDEIGIMPLPPYIKEELKDNDRYQTVYANNLGSAAAPTAGLHFTKDILEKLKRKNIEIVPITLHVGLGTFRPVKENNILNHQMHEEEYFLTEKSVKILNEAVKMNKKIVAVGTTSIRTLESNFINNQFTSGTYNTNIFIYPGYKFKVVDEIITNFHLPKSTLFMLVSAFSSVELMQCAYQDAIKNNFRFFSFGDAMYIK